MTTDFIHFAVPCKSFKYVLMHARNVYLMRRLIAVIDFAIVCFNVFMFLGKQM